MISGWYVVARVSDLVEPMRPAVVQGRRLLVARSPQGARVFSAVCPHRGADLAAGALEGSDVVRCPFHGLRIGLGGGAGRKRCVPELPSAILGDMVLARLGAGQDCGLAEAASALGSSHRFSRASTVRIRVPHHHVIENAFDELHFSPVHDVVKIRPFEVEHLPSGAVSASSRFTLPPSQWQTARPGKRTVDVSFRAIAYSPGLVVTRMGGQRPYVVLTGSTPVDDDECIVYLSIAVPHASGDVPDEDIEYLVRQGLAGLEKDRMIWETMTPGVVALESAERAVAAFQAFCAGFEAEPRS